MLLYVHIILCFGSAESSPWSSYTPAGVTSVEGSGGEWRDTEGVRAGAADAGAGDGRSRMSNYGGRGEGSEGRFDGRKGEIQG